MFNRLSLLIGVLMLTAAGSYAQTSLPVRSDILYEIKADSLSLQNIPQDLNISISIGSAQSIDAFVLMLDSAEEVLWTVVSAEMNRKPAWLIMSDAKPDRNDVLAWEFDREKNNLRFYPPDMGSGYELNMVVRMNLLRHRKIRAKSSKEVILTAQAGSQVSRCSTKGQGNRVTFR